MYSLTIPNENSVELIRNVEIYTISVGDLKMLRDLWKKYRLQLVISAS